MAQMQDVVTTRGKRLLLDAELERLQAFCTARAMRVDRKRNRRSRREAIHVQRWQKRAARLAQLREWL